MLLILHSSSYVRLDLGTEARLVQEAIMIGATQRDPTPEIRINKCNKFSLQ